MVRFVLLFFMGLLFCGFTEVKEFKEVENPKCGDLIRIDTKNKVVAIKSGDLIYKSTLDEDLFYLTKTFILYHSVCILHNGIKSEINITLEGKKTKLIELDSYDIYLIFNN